MITVKNKVGAFLSSVYSIENISGTYLISSQSYNTPCFLMAVAKLLANLSASAFVPLKFSMLTNALAVVLLLLVTVLLGFTSLEG